MASIKKIKNKNSIKYRATIRLKGFPTQDASFETEEEAEVWAKQTEDLLRESREVNVRPAFTYKFFEISERYKNEHLNSLSSSEMIKRKQQIHFWEEELGNVRINEITPMMIESILNKLSKTTSIKYKKPLSPNTLQRRLACLSHIFTFCVVKWKLLNKNPVQLVEKPSAKNCRMSKMSGEISADDVFSWLRTNGISNQEIDKLKTQLK